MLIQIFICLTKPETNIYTQKNIKIHIHTQTNFITEYQVVNIGIVVINRRSGLIKD